MVAAATAAFVSMGLSGIAAECKDQKPGAGDERHERQDRQHEHEFGVAHRSLPAAS
jgi:hypothetical protein